MQSSVLHITKDLVAETLAGTPIQGKRLLEPIKSRALNYHASINILEDHQVVNDAEVHLHEADLWHVLEGEVIFICGGQLTGDTWHGKKKDGTDNDNEIKAKDISGGQEIHVHVGDWLYIPAGIPHLHKTDGTCRMIIIKIPNVHS